MTTQIGASNVLTSKPADECEFVLLEKVARKDMEAFEILYMSYYQRLFLFALRLVRRRDVAEEVVNDAMVVVWQRACTFKQESHVSTWLLGIAYRKGIEYLRKVNRRCELLCESGPEIGEDPEPIAAYDPQRSLESGEFKEQLYRGIRTLCAEHRSVVELAALGYSYGEIATIVKCPLNTVKTRMFYARRRLRELVPDVNAQAAALSRPGTRGKRSKIAAGDEGLDESGTGPSTPRLRSSSHDNAATY